MKQITMDYETYQREIKEAKEDGTQSGFYRALRLLKGEELFSHEKVGYAYEFLKYLEQHYTKKETK